MIIIISDSYDNFSTEVEAWLHSFCKEHIRINAEDSFQSISWLLTDNNDCIRIGFHKDNKQVDLHNCTIWHRRGFFKPSVLLEEDQTDFSSFIKNESGSLFESIMMVLIYEDRVIGTHIFKKNLRLFNQFLASKVGIKVPASLVTTSKKDLIEFNEQHPKLVTKPIGDIFMGFVDKKPLRGRVNLMTKDILDKLPVSFFPMLFQEIIEKSFEIRLFICKNEFHAVAILLTDNTEIDYRFVSNDKIRQIPFEIPPVMKEKIKKMLEYLKLDTASLDIIVDTNGEYYFLDLNPFGMLHNNSFTYYYSTEKQIAKLLVTHEPKPIDI